MTEIEQIEEQILKLPDEELAKFRTWFMEFDAGVWERQVEAEFRADRLHGETTGSPAEIKPE